MAQAEIQGALANRLAYHIESNPLDPNVLEMLATCGGKASVVNLANILSKALTMLDEGADPSLVSDGWTRIGETKRVPFRPTTKLWH